VHGACIPPLWKNVAFGRVAISHVQVGQCGNQEANAEVSCRRRRTTSGAAGNGLITTAKYLRGVSGTGLFTTIKYLRPKTRQRTGRYDQVPAAHNKRRCRQRPEPIPGNPDVPIHQQAE
jgi:hypothetical protein